MCVCVGDIGADTDAHSPSARPPDFSSSREASELAVIIALLSLISGVLSEACRGSDGT